MANNNDTYIDFEIDKSSNEARPALKDKIFNLLNFKNFKILILLLIGLIGVVFLFGINSKKTEGNVVDTSSSGYTNTLSYCAELENKLQNVLSSVKGAGKVKVMISVDGSPEIVYANDTDEKTSSNSSGSITTSNSSSPIIVTVNGSSNALILTENLPSVKGVIVVSSGADDVSVKLDILNAVSRLLDISINQVSVLKGE